jgi:phosphoribosylformimino-5-aminoimidazole carboxamide ribotide isomerase
MLIIPAIDLLGGKCVRLTGGSFENPTVYSDDPVSTARSFADVGASWIHVVDLDGARAGRPVQMETVQRITSAVKCKVQFGGGLRRLDDVESALAAGVHRVVVGSALAADHRVAATFFERFGDRVAAGIDTRNGKVAVQAWAHTSALRGPEFAQSLVDMGCKTIIQTDVGRDGTMSGPNLEELRHYLAIDGVKVIASGGISGSDDLAALHGAGVSGAIIGKAVYEGRIALGEAVDMYQDHVET